MPFNIQVLVGSSSHNSHTLHLAQTIIQRLEDYDTTCSLFDLVEYQLPQYDLALEDYRKEHDILVKNFIQNTKESDGFIWGSPVYHGSFSGILKNALDWQHFFLDKKVVGLISNGSNRGIQTCNTLLQIARTQHMVPVSTFVCTNKRDYDDQKNVIAEDILTRIDHFCLEFVEYLARFKS